MHLEFLNVVQSYIRSVGVPSDVCSNIEVVNCPKCYNSELSTNVAFKLANKKASCGNVRKAFGQSITPLDIASVIARKVGGAQDYFVLDIGGQGYINATPTRRFVEVFIERVISVGVNVLFVPGSFVFNASVGEEGEESLAAFDVDWQDVIKRCCGSESEDVRDFAKLFGKQQSVSVEDRLMLLALLSDVELEVAPYELSLCGRQNVPWYFRKFFSDSNELFSKLKLETSVGSNVNYNCREFMEPCIWKVLGFRTEFLRAQRESEPQSLARSLMGIVQEYYLFYNHPTFRAYVSEGLEPRDRMYVAELSGALRDIVSKGLSLLLELR